MTSDRYDRDEEEGGNLLAHLPTIVRERYRWLLFPTILCFIAGIVAAFTLPAVYRSTATLLVESPPADLCRRMT